MVIQLPVRKDSRHFHPRVTSPNDAPEVSDRRLHTRMAPGPDARDAYRTGPAYGSSKRLVRRTLQRLRVEPQGNRIRGFRTSNGDSQARFGPISASRNIEGGQDWGARGFICGRSGWPGGPETRFHVHKRSPWGRTGEPVPPRNDREIPFECAQSALPTLERQPVPHEAGSCAHGQREHEARVACIRPQIGLFPGKRDG